jgi:hypothetical protein
MLILQKTLKIILVSILLYGCKEVIPGAKEVNAESLNYNELSNHGVQILTVDGCEYIWCKNGYGAGLTHKGNCKFCLSRNSKIK